MDILKIIGILVAVLVIMAGVIAIYDARKLSTKWFSFHDKNEATKWFKIGGFVISLIGILMLYFLR